MNTKSKHLIILFIKEAGTHAHTHINTKLILETVKIIKLPVKNHKIASFRDYFNEKTAKKIQLIFLFAF